MASGDPIFGYCETCDAAFVAGRDTGGGGFTLTGGGAVYVDHMGGGTVSGLQVQCPRCMNMASFPDGTIDFIRSSVATLRRMSQNDTRQLIEVLEKAKAGELDDEKALAHVPESVKPIVAAAMRRDRSDLWLPILLFIVSLLLTWKMSSDSTNSTKQHIAASQAQIAQEISQEQEFDRCLQQIVSAALAETPAEGSTAPASAAGGQAAPKATPPKRAILPATSVPTPAVLPSKNEVCWCGSGRLFKRCHRTSTAGS